MESLKLNELNLVEMKTKEMKETNGGCLFLAILIVAFAAGVVAAYYDNK